MVNRYMETASEGTRGLFMFCTIDNDKDVDVFQALATVETVVLLSHKKPDGHM